MLIYLYSNVCILNYSCLQKIYAENFTIAGGDRIKIIELRVQKIL